MEPYDRIVEALEKAWAETCAGFKSDHCESCRAYEDAIMTVRWVEGHA
jgi:hypothetical protein